MSYHQPFSEQVEFFRRKLNLPTEYWDDIERMAHDRAFIVAGAQGGDLLADLRRAIDKAIAQGTGLDEFRRDFKQIVLNRGWTGWTGEGSKGGEAWRTKVIYQTNMATSYAAGRWKQLNNPALLKIMPYWQYHHNDSVMHPRPIHLSWDGLTLPHDHPFWQTHFAPNGWGCMCWIIAVSKLAYMKAVASGKGQPPEGWDTIDPKTGTPVGIDKGFDYAPGRTWHPDLDKYPYEIARQMVQDNMRDGIFERWHKKIAANVAEELFKSEYLGLSNEKIIFNLRKKLARSESYPVAVLPADSVARMGIDTRVVLISDYDLIKQQVSRSNQDFDALEYFQAQVSFDNPRLIVNENVQMTLFVSDASGKWYMAVLQQTSTGKAIFLKSFRRSSRRDAALQRKKGVVLLDLLEG